MDKLTIEKTLRYLADNAKDGNFYVRIGFYLLDTLDVGLDTNSEERPNKFVVRDMRLGKNYRYNDLFKAIVKFVELVNAD